MTSIDWGPTAAWVSAILTSGSLSLGFYILLRDRRKEERSDAAKIMCWRVWSSNEYATHVLNASDRVIVDVGLLVRLPESTSFNELQFEGFGVAAVVRPGEEVVRTTERGGLGDRTVPNFVTFQDPDGLFWIRDLPTGELRRLSRRDRGTGYSLLDQYLNLRRRKRVTDRLRKVLKFGRSEQ